MINFTCLVKKCASARVTLWAPRLPSSWFSSLFWVSWSFLLLHHLNTLEVSQVLFHCFLFLTEILKTYCFKFIISAERELKDSRRSGRFQSCIRRSRNCFGISSRYLWVLWFILTGERNNYQEETFITFGKNKEEIIITSGLPRA